MKPLTLLFPILLLSGCVTLDWTGHNFDDYVLEKGVPTSQYKRQDSKTVYSFKHNCADSTEQKETIVVVNTDNVIESVSQTHFCPSPRIEEPEPIIVPPPVQNVQSVVVVVPQQSASTQTVPAVSQPVAVPASSQQMTQAQVLDILLDNYDRAQLETQLQTVQKEIQEKSAQSNQKRQPILNLKLELQMAKDYAKRQQIQQKISNAEREVALLENDIKRLKEKEKAIQAKLKRK